jgi:hypothetical protein
VATTAAPPASHTGLLNDACLFGLESMNAGRERRGVGIWTYNDIGNSDHAEERDQRKKDFHGILPYVRFARGIMNAGAERHNIPFRDFAVT